MAIKYFGKFINGNSNDLSGNGYNGTDTSISYSSGGAIGTASNSNINLPSGASITGSGTRSAVIFTALNMDATYNQPRFISYGVNTAGNYWDYAIVTTATPRMQHSISFTEIYTSTGTYTNDNNFRTIGYTYNGGNTLTNGFKPYSNAIELTLSTGSANTPNTTSSTVTLLNLGRSLGNSSRPNGKTQYIILFNHVLSKAEFKNYNSFFKGFI